MITSFQSKELSYLMIMKNIYKGSMKTSASEATHFEHFYKLK